jgi:hypothetical protein
MAPEQPQNPIETRSEPGIIIVKYKNSLENIVRVDTVEPRESICLFVSSFFQVGIHSFFTTDHR